VLAGRLDLRVVELMCGEALLARANGELDARLRHGFVELRASAMGDHWREYQCLIGLATVMFERGAYSDVTRLAGEIVSLLCAERDGACLSRPSMQR
jgi:hypothetical protein